MKELPRASVNVRTLGGVPRTLFGVTLVETVIAVALITVVFLGFFGAYTVSARLVKSASARTSALTLVASKLEYVRGMRYTDVGVSGSTPTGTLSGAETVELNNIIYTLRTIVANTDDTANGAGGVDYKTVKVEADWMLQDIPQRVSLVTYVAP